MAKTQPNANQEAKPASVDVVAALRQFTAQVPDHARIYIESATELVAGLLDQPHEGASQAAAASDDAILSDLRRLAARLSNRAARVHIECAIQEAEDWRHGKDAF